MSAIFNLVFKLAFTSVVFAFNDKLVFISDVFAFNANAVVAANMLKSWSPVLVPEIAPSFVFSAVVKSLLDKTFPIILSTLVAILALIGAKSNVFAANWVGVTYCVVLSAKFTLVAILALIGAKSNVFAANWVGVT